MMLNITKLFVQFLNSSKNPVSLTLFELLTIEEFDHLNNNNTVYLLFLNVFITNRV